MTMEILSEIAKTYKYAKFLWRAEWVEFAATITDPDAKGLFYRSVMDYGLMCEINSELAGNAREYFESVVIPDLDKQHARAKTQR